MTLQQFYAQYNGHYLEADGAYPNQCVDLTKKWQMNLVLPVTHGNAINWPANADKAHYTWVVNGLHNKPDPGDIVVFNRSFGAYGHIGVCWSANYINLTCFEQNNPIGSPCHLVYHPLYRGVWGWLKPKH